MSPQISQSFSSPCYLWAHVVLRGPAPPSLWNNVLDLQEGVSTQGWRIADLSGEHHLLEVGERHPPHLHPLFGHFKPPGALRQVGGKEDVESLVGVAVGLVQEADLLQATCHQPRLL